jgi:hypothetical protein
MRPQFLHDPYEASEDQSEALTEKEARQIRRFLFGILALVLVAGVFITIWSRA